MAGFACRFPRLKFQYGITVEFLVPRERKNVTQWVTWRQNTSPRKKKQKPRPVKLRCLECNTQYDGNYHHAGIITSYLNMHIFSKLTSSYEYYVNNKLIDEHIGNAIILTSIVNSDDQQSSEKKLDTSTHQFTPTDFGLTSIPPMALVNRSS